MNVNYFSTRAFRSVTWKVAWNTIRWATLKSRTTLGKWLVGKRSICLKPGAHYSFLLGKMSFEASVLAYAGGSSVRWTFSSFLSPVTRGTNIQHVEYFLPRMTISCVERASLQLRKAHAYHWQYTKTKWQAEWVSSRCNFRGCNFGVARAQFKCLNCVRAPFYAYALTFNVVTIRLRN